MKAKDGWPVLVVCLVLGLGTLALYSPALTYSFVNLDDRLLVLDNPHVKNGLAAAFGWAFKTSYGNAWQPLTWLSHALDCRIYGLKPGGHHATNLLLHALNSVLVFLVLRQLTGAFWRSAAVAAFFAWHPLHVEVAAWVAERKGLLCAFFWLLALWGYACYAQKLKAKLPSAKYYYLASIVLFAFSLMSKPAGVALPLILFLLDWWPLGRMGATAQRPNPQPIFFDLIEEIPLFVMHAATNVLKKVATPVGLPPQEPIEAPPLKDRSRALFLLAEKIPFVLLSAASCVLTITALSGNQFLEPVAQLPFKTRFVTAGMSCFRYLLKSFWPSDLGPHYPFVFHRPLLELLIVALLLAGISIAVVLVRQARPYWLVGWFWFLVLLFPTMNLLQTGAQPMADRYMYLPSIGLWMVFCWEAWTLAGALPYGRKALGGLCAILLAACCVATLMQLRFWKNEGTLVVRIPDSSRNALGHADYASYLMRRGQLPQARAECEKAIAISPDFLPLQERLGEILFLENKYDESIQKLRRILHEEPGMNAARLQLGKSLLSAKRAAEAEEELKTAVGNEMQNHDAHHWLARAYMAQGKLPLALMEFGASLKLEADQPDTLNDLAWLLATTPQAEFRRGAQAVQLAGRACVLSRLQEPLFLGTMAAALAEKGDFDKAVQAAQKAHDLAVAQGRKALAETDLHMLALFRNHQPLRETN